MRIAYVIGSMEIGGAEQHVLRTAQGLRSLGFSPEVFTLVPGGPLTQPFLDSGIKVTGAQLPDIITKIVRHKRAVAWLGLLHSSATLWWFYWRRRFDVVHFFLPAAYIVGGVVALAGPRMHRLMSRRSLNHYQAKHRLFRHVEHWLHPTMDVVCGNSRAVLDDLAAEGVQPEKLRLIYNGVDLARFQNAKPRGEVRSDLRISEQAVVFVMVANLIPYKGHADLIEAFALAADRLPAGWVCLCVGRDDGIGPALQNLATEKGVAANLRFLGSRTDVADLLCAADIGVLCSHEEGFSNAVLEGMAAGLPMVVTDVGGNAEAVVNDDTGVVVPPRSPRLLAEALEAVVCQDDRSQMGLRGKQRAHTMFSMEACVQAYVDLYRSLR